MTDGGFAPAYGDVGSWVRLPDGRQGQVWADAGCRYRRLGACVMHGPDRTHGPSAIDPKCVPAVWVVDGDEWTLVEVADLHDPAADSEPVPDDDDQAPLFT